MKILVRLPNWLGDMIMSIGFINAIHEVYPGAQISVIAKKGIDGLLEFFPSTSEAFIFSKDEYPGITGAWRFGKMIHKKEKYDLFFCLPDSFSSALMGFAAGAKKRIGYGKELRGLLLTSIFKKQPSLHRAEEYINLLEQYINGKIKQKKIFLNIVPVLKDDHFVVNINSEASSRRLPALKAISLIAALRQRSESHIYLIGGNKDAAYTEEVFRKLPHQEGIFNMAGKTSLKELVSLMASARVVLTTDSGPAHLANATGTYTVVLFGAGNEKNTAPYNAGNRSIIRLGHLPCEPCVKNTCVLYGIPKCLELLNEEEIIEKVMNRRYEV